VNIRRASDRSLLVSFGEEIPIEAHRAVSVLTCALTGLRGIVNLHPAYASVLVDYDPRMFSHTAVEELVRHRMESASGSPPAPARTIEIPVRYGGEDGPDLEDVARHAGLDPRRVVELHASAEYVVWFVGFATCFPYLGGLPPESIRWRRRAAGA